MGYRPPIRRGDFRRERATHCIVQGHSAAGPWNYALDEGSDRPMTIIREKGAARCKVYRLSAASLVARVQQLLRWATVWPQYRHGPKTGGGATSVPSGIFIHPTVWPQYTNVTDRQEIQTNIQHEGAVAYGEPLLVTVTSKRLSRSKCRLGFGHGWVSTSPQAKGRF